MFSIPQFQSAAPRPAESTPHHSQESESTLVRAYVESIPTGFIYPITGKERFDHHAHFHYADGTHIHIGPDGKRIKG